MWACYKACKGPAWNEESTSQVEPSAQVLVKVLILSALFGSLFYPDSRRPLSALCFCIQSNEAKGETKWFIFCQLFQPWLQRSVQPGHLPNRHRGQQMRHAQRSFKPCIKFWLMQPENILRTWQRSKHGLHGLWSSRIIIHPIMGIQMYGYTIPQNGQFTQLSTMARKCTRRNNADAETASQKYCSNV